jgi:hypothetical protein
VQIIPTATLDWSTGGECKPYRGHVPSPAIEQRRNISTSAKNPENHRVLAFDAIQNHVLADRKAAKAAPQILITSST